MGHSRSFKRLSFDRSFRRPFFCSNYLEWFLPHDAMLAQYMP